MKELIQIEDLRIEIIRSPNRKTLEIIVERNGELTLRIPEICHIDKATDFVKNKLLWIYEKLEKKELYQAPNGAKEFVNGEGFFYLGESYRLQITESQEVPLMWDGVHFLLSKTELSNSRDRSTTNP